MSLSSGSNNFTGSVTINDGVLNASATGARGSSSNTLTVASGATLQVQGSTSFAQALMLAGTLASVGGDNLLSGPVTLTASSTFDSAIVNRSLTLSGGISAGIYTPTFTGPGGAFESGVVTGSGGLAKGLTSADNGYLEFSGGGPNTFTGGVMIKGGRLDAFETGALGNNANTVTVANDAQFAVGGILIAQSVTLSGTSFDTEGQLSGVGGAGTISGAITLAANSTIGNIDGSNALTLSGGIVEGSFTPTFLGIGNILVSGPVTGSGGLTKGAAANDTSTLTLSSATSNFTGAVAINDGVVNVQSNNALGSSGNTVTVASGAALQLQGALSISQPLNLAGTGVGGSGSLVSIAASSTASGPITLSANATIDNATSATALTLSGGIVESTFTPAFIGVGTIIETVQSAAPAV